MTLRLFNDYFIGEATTITRPYWLSGESPKRAAARAANGSAPPAAPSAAGLPRRVEGARLQAAGLTPQQVRRVCTADSVSALASDPHTVGADPAGLAWSAICCAVWHGFTTGAHRCALIYLIIIGRLCCPIQRPAWRWYLVFAGGATAL